MADILSMIANPAVANVPGQVMAGRADAQKLRMNEQTRAMNQIEIDKAKAPPSAKDRLAEVNARAQLAFQSLKGVRDEQTYRQAQVNLKGLVDLPDAYDPKAVEFALADAAMGIQGTTEFAKAYADAEVLAAQGNMEAAEEVLRQAQAKYSGKDEPKMEAIYDVATGKSLGTAVIRGTTISQNGNLLDPSKVTTEKQITKAEEGGPGSFDGTKKEGEGLREMEYTTQAALNLTKRIREQVNESGAGIMGVVGAGQRLAGALAAQLEAAASINENASASVNGEKAQESALRDAANYTKQLEESFGKAGKSAAMRANIVDLAYTLARAKNPDGRISNQDVNHKIELLGNNGDPAQLLAVLDEIDLSLVGNYEARAASLNVPPESRRAFGKPPAKNSSRLDELKRKHLGQ